MSIFERFTFSPKSTPEEETTPETLEVLQARRKKISDRLEELQRNASSFGWTQDDRVLRDKFEAELSGIDAKLAGAGEQAA